MGLDFKTGNKVVAVKSFMGKPVMSKGHIYTVADSTLDGIKITGQGWFWKTNFRALSPLETMVERLKHV